MGHPPSSLQHKWFVAVKKMAEFKLAAAPQLMHSFCRAQGVSEAALQRVLGDINLLEVHLGGAYTDAELAAAAGSVRRACVEGSTWSSCIVQRPFFPRKRSGRGRTVQADGRRMCSGLPPRVGALSFTSACTSSAPLASSRASSWARPSSTARHRRPAGPGTLARACRSAVICACRGSASCRAPCKCCKCRAGTAVAGSEASRGSKAGTGSSTARAARGTARARHPTEADGVAGRSWAGSERSAWDQRGDPAAFCCSWQEGPPCKSRQSGAARPWRHAVVTAVISQPGRR